MANIYDINRYGKAVFLVVSVIVVALFVYFSNGLIEDLSQQERERMQIWADATKEIIDTSNAAIDGEGGDVDVEFLLSIIEANRNIPVLLVDDQDNILDKRNFDLPDKNDEFSLANQQFLEQKLHDLKGTTNVIEIEISPENRQYL